MLILTRYPGQKIRIGEDIVVTFLGYGRNDVARIGIDAPQNVKILRVEIPDRDKEEGNGNG